MNTLNPLSEPPQQRPPPANNRLWGNWWREPTVHFFVAGTLLFFVYAWLNPTAELSDAQTIVLTNDDLVQMTLEDRAKGMSPPSRAQLQTMLEAKIREEVLYREALAMGLDQDDTIVKRRMAQKMDFLAEDLSALREPTHDELVSWLQAHPEAFAYAPRMSFRHVYFSFDKYGAKTKQHAAATLENLRGLEIDANEVKAAGDPFMFQDFYAERTPEQVASVFGGNFAQDIFRQQTGAWVGPIESGFGWHLIFIDALTPARNPEFEEVEAEVAADWMTQQRAEFKQAAYDMMRAKYKIVLPESLRKDVAPAGNNPTMFSVD